MMLITLQVIYSCPDLYNQYYYCLRFSKVGNFCNPTLHHEGAVLESALQISLCLSPIFVNTQPEALGGATVCLTSISY